jgi:hypothetical protein
MLVFSYAVEVDARGGTGDSELEDLLTEAAKAYRDRGACFLAKGDGEAERRDVRRAENLEARLKKDARADKVAADGPVGANEILLRNGWKEAITVIVGGKEYSLQVGERKRIVAPAASFAYEVKGGSGSNTGTLEAGKAYRIGE